MSLPLLPSNILQGMVCHECFGYLSVPPIVNNKSGGTVCGRCIETDIDVKKEYTSLYNTIGTRFLFKCINHYNGCSQLLTLTDAKEHEMTCCFMVQQQCIFCSFSGVLSQILYHCLKVHIENVTTSGKVTFTNSPFQKELVFVSNENIFHLSFCATDELVSVKIETLTNSSSSSETPEFGVKFFKPDANEYGVIDVCTSNYYEKRKDELTTGFGSWIELCCQIFVEHFTLEKELEFKDKFFDLSKCKRDLTNREENLHTQEQVLSEQTTIWEDNIFDKDNLYNLATKLIKIFSSNFKCYSCQKVTLADIFSCPKNHFYCVMFKKCLCSLRFATRI